MAAYSSETCVVAIEHGGKMADFVAYYRVSTDKQGERGLGMQAQHEAVAQYLTRQAGQLLKEFLEVETGKHGDRPQLQAALALCRQRKATLVIAKLDRLARNVAVIANLMESGVEFVAADMPHANRLTIHIIAAVAEYEREMISRRTKEGLAVLKAQGVKLGNPRHAEFLASARAVKRRAHEPRRAAALPLLLGLREQGLTLRAIADEMNRRGVRPTGHARVWHASSVRYHLLQHRPEPSKRSTRA